MLWIGHHPKKGGYLYLYKIALIHKQTFQGGTSVEEGKVISDDEMKERFDYFSSVFKSDDAADKFGASANMLLLLSNYLSQRIDDFDVYPFTSVLQEFALIDNGNEPTFIKPSETKKGRPMDVVSQMYAASVVASVNILSKHGYSVSESSSFVANCLREKKEVIEQLRSDFNRRKKIPQFKDFMRAESNKSFENRVIAESYVQQLLSFAKQTLT